MSRAVIAACALCAGAGAARAQGDVPAPAPVPPPPAAAPEPEPEPEPDLAPAEDVDAREARLDRDLRKLAAAQDSTRRRVDDLAPASRFLSAYVDAGFFVPGGNGAGTRSDLGHLRFPQYDGKVLPEWVFMGDPLSTAINSRGEPADTGSSRSVTDDSIDSQGNPAFIANAIGLRLARDINDGVKLAAHVEILPRGRTARFEVETARIEYQPWEDRDLVFAAGKLDSVLGMEYRTQDAPRRLTVTPSLLCRYTCGRPVGVQARYAQPRWAASVAVSSGDSFQQTFEADGPLVSSTLPTVSARASIKAPLGAGRVIAGVSSAVGPQDRQPDDGLVQWHYGLDLSVRDFHDVDVTVEWMHGRLPGADAEMEAADCGKTECLRYHGIYALVGYHATPWLQPYARVDWRDAVHEHGAQFAYVSKTARLTTGLHFEMGRRVVAKMEYILNRELGNIPQFPNDVLTTSVVVSTD